MMTFTIAACLFAVVADAHTTSLLELKHSVGPIRQYGACRLTILQYFLRFSCCQNARVQQGHYGGVFAKPTDLLVVHGGSQVKELLLTQRTTERPNWP